MYRIAICDDNKEFLNKAEQYVKGYAQKKGIAVEQTVYQNGGFLADDICSGIQYDIYILDIEMPEITGTDIVKMIRARSSEAIVIFVTAHLQYTLESFELEVFRYIPKSALEERLPGALQAAFLKLDSQDGKYYLISNAKRSQKVFYKDILYVYKNEKNSNFVLRNGEEIYVRESLFEVYRKLPEKEFMQTDRCYIVNLSQIQKVDSVNGRLFLQNKIELDISKSRIQEVKKRVNQFWGDKL